MRNLIFRNLSLMLFVALIGGYIWYSTTKNQINAQTTEKDAPTKSSTRMDSEKFPLGLLPSTTNPKGSINPSDIDKLLEPKLGILPEVEGEE